MAFTLKKAAPPAKKAPAKKLAAPSKKAAPRRVADDEDDAPAPRKGAAKKSAAAKRGVVTSGWDGAEGMGGGSDFIRGLDFKNDAAKHGDTLWFILKFMEDGPYANVKIHWIDGRKGKKSFVCIGEDCPLCDVGSETKQEMRFNVAVFGEEEPVVRSWAAGWKIYKKIKSYAEAPLTKPLPKRLYLATRTGKTWSEIQYDLMKITPEEVAEAYPDIYVPSADEIAALEPYTLDDVEKEYSTVQELEEIAAEIVEGEE